MGLKTGRAEEAGEVVIDKSRCIVCGKCVEVCPGNPLMMVENEIIVDQQRLFGCIGCGHCMSVCPEDAIAVTGRDLSPEDLRAVPAHRAEYEALYDLMLARRSARRFLSDNVSEEAVRKILAAAAAAPMGVPPSDVEVIVFSGRAKMQQLAEDMMRVFRGNAALFSSPLRFAFQPFIGRKAVGMLHSFVAPVLKEVLEGRSRGEDLLFYDAPLGMYFHAPASADPQDPVIAATHALLAAESLGLGTCFIGLIGPFIVRDPKLRAKYGIAKGNHPGSFVIFGYAAVERTRTLIRRFAKVQYY